MNPTVHNEQVKLTATWLNAAGTSMPSSENTTEPSGLRISDLVARNSMPS